MKVLMMFLVSFLLITTLFSQGVNRDPLSDSQASNEPAKLYDRAMSGNEPIINGRDYIFYNFKMEGNPYLEQGEFSKGLVSYQGKLYDPVDLLYDISRNQLVISNGGRSIVLHNEWVDSFSLRGHKFIALDPTTKQGLSYSGFYDILYRGRLELLAFRESSSQDAIENGSPVRVFLTRNHYFINRNGNYFSVRDRQDIFRLFDDRKHEVKKFIRKNHMRMQLSKFEETLEKVTAFYDQGIH